MMKIKLGMKVKDRITGFTGIAIGITEWLNGCMRVTIQPQELNKDGKPAESACFDVQQVVSLEEAIPVAQPAAETSSEAVRRPGGPMPEPRRNADPVR